MTIDELRKRRNAAHDEAAKILADADAAKGLDQEQLTHVQELTAECKSLENQIDVLEVVSGRTTALAASTGRTAGPVPPVANPEQVVTEIRDKILDDPMRGFATPRDFMHCVIDAGMGRAEDKRLAPIKMTAGSDEQGGYADPYGGFLIPSGMTPTPKSLIAEGDFLASRTTSIPMTAPKIAFNARVDKTHTTSVSGGLRVYRREESAAVTASRMSFEQVELNAHSLMGVAYATNEILSDSPVSFAALIASGWREEMGSKLMGERLTGTGIGEFLGVMNCGSLISISKESGQAADTIIFKNIIKMRARCWRYGKAIWLVNHDCLPQLMQLSVTVGASGVPVWQASAREDHPDMLLGRPCILTEYADTIGDKGDIILGNWAEYVEGTYQPLRSDESMHVRFLNNENAFRITMRNDGCPWWRAALTTKNSTVTIGPFVALNARA